MLNNLYKHTALQTSFGIILLAISENRPRVLPLVEIVSQFLDFRRNVVRRRTTFELKKAEARVHILEGFVKALDHLDQIIELIRAASTPADARSQLMESVRVLGDPGAGCPRPPTPSPDRNGAREDRQGA